jgi:hypothetical protein
MDKNTFKEEECKPTFAKSNLDMELEDDANKTSYIRRII